MMKMMKKICSILLSVSLCAALLPGVTLAEDVRENEPPAVDLDLTQMSGTMTYSHICQMMYDPDAYRGKVIKLTGWFDVFTDDETGMVYTSCFVPDAAACCAQGLEFVWACERAYPDDYREIGAYLTVTGRFETYLEDGWEFIHLVDADVVWAD